MLAKVLNVLPLVTSHPSYLLEESVTLIANHFTLRSNELSPSRSSPSHLRSSTATQRLTRNAASLVSYSDDGCFGGKIHPLSLASPITSWVYTVAYYLFLPRHPSNLISQKHCC
jgi:hypothetical protein